MIDIDSRMAEPRRQVRAGMKKSMRNKSSSAFSSRLCKAAQWPLAVVLGMFSAVSSLGAVEIAQQPLYAGSRVPGNIVLVPSVEFPTIDSQANLGGYNHSRRYSGYFDPQKCYLYQWRESESERHFKPTRISSNFECPVREEWSGNYLNWATTQTIDPFRYALTGGYRVKDKPGETWLQKARHDRNDTDGSYFPDRRMPGSGNNHDLVKKITGASWGSVKVRVRGLGHKLWFTADRSLNDPSVVSYNPSKHKLEDNEGDWGRVYELSVRVKVCDPDVGLEDNCREYSEGWKPEGLIQEYSDRIRYSIFGFLNDHSASRNGGVLRARQKFVGPRTHYPELGEADNPAKEWDVSTGVLLDNPDSADSLANSGLGIKYSGVINYLNRFGQMTSKAPKDKDPVSELYYAMLRYFRGQGNLSEYTNNLSYDLADGFPVITKWDDPIRYACQVNAALGIGDVYTHVDHDIPGADLTLAREYTQKIFDFEGIGKQAGNEFTGRGNSAYIAGLAYYANANDLRLDDPKRPNTIGRQTLSTYWVDVRETQTLEPKVNNQYWLTAKYGGANIPAGFDPLGASGLQSSWWHNSGEYLTSGKYGDVTTDANNYPRPDNFYVASEADKMVDSLRLAFQNIVDEVVGSGGGFAANTTSLEAGAMTYQALFRVDGGSWAGELRAFQVDPFTGNLTPDWTASSKLPSWDSRNIWVNSDGFKELTSTVSLPGIDAATRDYLRGDRTQERPNGTLRARNGLLGSIVNSEPVYVGAPNPYLFMGAPFKGADVYQDFAAENKERRSIVYVGANDGMLHGFDAETGEEVFAFMPKAVIDGGIKDYASPDYQHRYFVDGDMTVADVYHATSGWRTILVGTLGRGGRAMFALDVTEPNDIKFLWEKNASDIPGMGNILGKPIIAQVADGDWQVFVGNGPNGAGGESRLLMLDVSTGNPTVINTGVGGDNGLSGVNVWASTPGGFSDRVYAGDLKGNMWRFSRNSSGSWTAGLLFKAAHGTTQQPITATPLVARRPGTTETWVMFGTGRYLNSADLGDKGVQSWYGLLDGGAEVSKSSLDRIKVIAEAQIGGVPVRGIEESHTVGSAGWYMDLLPPDGKPAGERMVVPNQFRGTALIGTTRIPDTEDICSPSGTGFVMAINPFTGGRLSGGFFDIDGDGKFDETIAVGDTQIPVSGVGMPSGPNDPTFVGELMIVGLDDASEKTLKTNVGELRPRRVSWRELLRN